MKLQQEIVDNFIIEMTLINPIEDIITKLNNNEFRDCDIKWLDAKLEKFMSLACEILGVKGVLPSSIEKEPFTIMNPYVQNKYLHYFSGLLNYYKTFV